MKKSISFRLLWLVCIFALSSCGLIIKSEINKDNNCVPADFGKYKSTVLIVKWKKEYNRKVEKLFKENYKGDYLLVPNNELATTYSDASKYRYIFDNSEAITRYSDMQSSASLSFHITDRVANKRYGPNVSSGVSWGTVARTYIKKLEKARAQNSY